MKTILKQCVCILLGKQCDYCLTVARPLEVDVETEEPIKDEELQQIVEYFGLQWNRACKITFHLFIK